MIYFKINHLTLEMDNTKEVSLLMDTFHVHVGLKYH